jgi:hypothetical protein
LITGYHSRFAEGAGGRLCRFSSLVRNSIPG